MEKLDKTYEFVGELAVALHAKKIKMSFATLNRTLKDNGFKPYKGSRGVASAIRGAHKAWGNLDSNVSSAIANTYVDKNDQYIWLKSELEKRVREVLKTRANNNSARE